MATKPPTTILELAAQVAAESAASQSAAGGVPPKPGTGLVPAKPGTTVFPARSSTAILPVATGGRSSGRLAPVAPPAISAKANEKFKDKMPLFTLCFVVMGGLLALNLILTLCLLLKSAPTIPEEDMSAVNAPVMAQIELLRVELEKVRTASQQREAEFIRLQQQVGGVEAQMGFLSTKQMENVPLHPLRKIPEVEQP